jgi:hypothetical protein
MNESEETLGSLKDIDIIFKVRSGQTRLSDIRKITKLFRDFVTNQIPEVVLTETEDKVVSNSNGVLIVSSLSFHLE